MHQALVALVSRHRLPTGHAAIGDDEPDLAIVAGACRIARARLGAAIGVAVIMADDMAIFGADIAVGGEQNARIDFKPGGRMRMDILRGHHNLGEPRLARYKAAAFVRKRRPRFTQQGFNHPA